jgi:hypothetical protein
MCHDLWWHFPDKCSTTWVIHPALLSFSNTCWCQCHSFNTYLTPLEIRICDSYFIHWLNPFFHRQYKICPVLQVSYKLVDWMLLWCNGIITNSQRWKLTYVNNRPSLLLNHSPQGSFTCQHGAQEVCMKLRYHIFSFCSY